MSTTGKSASVVVTGQTGAWPVTEASFAGANAAFTSGDTLAADAIDTLAADSADTLAVDLGQGIGFTGSSAAEEI